MLFGGDCKGSVRERERERELIGEAEDVKVGARSLTRLLAYYFLLL